MLGKLRTKIAVATAGLMVFAIAGTGVALAQDAPPADPPPEQAGAHQLIIKRAAEILEIDAESLGSAMQQAKQAVDRERLDAHVAELLAKAVENESLTQEEADEILVWWLARPEGATPQLVKMLAQHGDDVDPIFARLVESGKLTEEEAAAIGEWFAAQPDSLENVARLLNGGKGKPRPQARLGAGEDRPELGERRGQGRPQGGQAQGRVRPGQGRGPVLVLPDHGRGRIDLRFDFGRRWA